MLLFKPDICIRQSFGQLIDKSTRTSEFGIQRYVAFVEFCVAFVECCVAYVETRCSRQRIREWGLDEVIETIRRHPKHRCQPRFVFRRDIEFIQTIEPTASVSCIQKDGFELFCPSDGCRWLGSLDDQQPWPEPGKIRTKQNFSFVALNIYL